MTSTAVHLILGDDEFLAERARRRILSGLDAGVETTTVRAGDLTEPELIELTSPSLFAEDRVIVVTHTELAGKHPTELLLATAVDPGPGITLIIHHTGGGRNKALVKKFEKIAEVHRADSLKPRDLHNWVTAEFREHGVRPTPDVVHAILEGVGSDPRELASAVSQLVSDTGGEVALADVRRYYQGVAEVSGFDIADLAVSGQTVKAVASTRRALQLGISPVALAAALGSKVGTIARLYSTRGGNPRQLAGVLGMHPFVVEKTLPVARRWSGTAVSRAVVIVADLDARAKGAGGDIDFAVENAVRKIAELAR
ncbi:DNA polymerase III subunit delta [Corynebacterium uterequi]|uniref:DNA-directed DNA polymerase n=1 Tax=Corynebacterium uterequi TaxID=1072256 RepID=A0A0G3HKJ0_9CORY|nr:DNA polymerase III subunit delta [Corynebacterium uterequi]AKK11617.1 DNA polymerase III, delta subunit [Corynebacterium uterequi]